MSCGRFQALYKIREPFTIYHLSATVFEIFALKDRKLLILPTPPLFDAPLGGIPQNFWMKLTLQKLEGLGYRMLKISSS